MQLQISRGSSVQGNEEANVKIIQGTVAVIVLSAGLSWSCLAHAQGSRDTAAQIDAEAAPWRSSDVNARTTALVFSDDQRFDDPMRALSNVVAERDKLRLIRILGENHVRNLYDLLYLRGVDMALVRSDAVEFVKRSNEFPGITRVVNVLARVSEEKILLAAGNAVRTIDDLAGKRVALGRRGSGEHLTGSVILETLGIDAKIVHLPLAEAAEQLGNGEIDAMIRLIGTQAADRSGLDGSRDERWLLDRLENMEGIGILPIGLNDDLADIYTQARLTDDDLPRLLEEGVELRTLAVQTVLAANRWPPQHPRYEQMTRFVQSFLASADALTDGASADYWAGLDFDAEVPGVPRLNILAALEEAEALAARRVARSERISDLSARKAALEQRRERINALLADRLGGSEEAELQALLNQLDQLVEELDEAQPDAVDSR